MHDKLVTKIDATDNKIPNNNELFSEKYNMIQTSKILKKKLKKHSLPKKYILVS